MTNKEYHANWREKNRERLRNLYKIVFRKNKKSRLESTNKWRNSISEDQKLIGYSDTTLLSFTKAKLIMLIRKMELKIQELESVSGKHNKKKK